MVIMEKAKNFCEWFLRMGGYVPVNCEEVLKDYSSGRLLVSSFKERASEIKRKYNYIFKKKNIDHTMEYAEDISYLRFDKK